MGYKITKNDILDFVQEIIKGDKNDKIYQRKIIDNLVYKVYITDDDTIVYINLKGGKEIETISFQEHNDALSGILNVKGGVQTQSLPSRQR